MALQDLPTELLRAISENILVERDLSALSQTCVRFFHVLVPELYRLNHLHHLDHLNDPNYTGVKTSAISWAIKKMNMPTIQRATRLGIDIVKLHHVTEAALLGYCDVFELLWACKLEHGGFEILTADEEGREPFLAAVRSGRKEIIRALLDTGKVDTQVQALHTNKPLYIAATTGQHEIVKLLLDHGASARAQLYGIAPIMAALLSPDTRPVRRHFWGKGLSKPRDSVVDTVRILLEHGAEVGYREEEDENGHYDEETPLHVAASANYCDVAELLIAHGADINAPHRRTQNTPLHHATQHTGHLEMVKTLIKLGANPNTFNYYGKTPLALTPDTLEPVALTRFLLENGAQMIVDTGHNTPLHHLKTVGSLDLIDTLLELGADINAQNNDGQTPLHRICEATGQHILMRRLIDRGASLTILDGYGVSPLGAAATHCSQDTIEYMIGKGSDPNSKSRNGLPLLQVAISRESTQLFECLLGLGADPAVPNHHGRCALHYAAMVGRINVMEILFKHGVSIDAHDANGLTALMSSIEGVTSDGFDFLLKKGASVKERDERMQIPLHKAAKHGKVRAALMMLELGADINAVDDRNQTPLRIAHMHQRPTMVEVLLDQGADETITP